jgi:hypothetical protein
LLCIRGLRARRHLDPSDNGRPGAASRLEIERRVVDDFFHDKERTGLADARQRKQLFTVELSEIGDVLDSNLDKEVEVTGHQMAIKHKRQFPDRRFKGRKALLRRAVEHHADNDERAAVNLVWRNIGPHGADIALLKQPLGPPVARGRTDVGGLGQIGVRHPSVALQAAKQAQVDAVDTPAQTRAQLRGIVDHTAELVELGRKVRDDEIVIFEDYAYPAYGVPSNETNAAIRLAARTEAMITDPVYEGKSMQGMIDLVRKGYFPEGAKVLYAHLGGAPALNGYSYTYRNG